MGTQTSLPIDSIYKQRPIRWTRRCGLVLYELIDFNHVICVKTNKSCGYGCKVYSRGEWAQLCGDHPEFKNLESHQIKFKSHMRDFEVIPNDNLTIAQDLCSFELAWANSNERT